MGGSQDEFPLLSALGLYAADIRGDGNCLFNALSDQLYGHQSEHHKIRARVIDYMREHADYYKMFIDVHPGGGVRRNPKRKNAGAYSSQANAAAPPTSADIDNVFESHLQSMARGGTYGDNMEISAFSSAFNVDVKIYQRDFAYMVTGSQDESPRDVAHIAYHMWEHYSSIRNLDGPHSGSPNVKARALSPEEEEKQKQKLAQTPVVLPWQIDVVLRSLPYLADRPTVKKALEQCRGNVNDAVSKLMDGEESRSVSSAQESSSVEREADSDDEASSGPNKKQDRRMSRHNRTNTISKERVMSKLATYGADDSQDSVASNESDASSMPSASQMSSFGGDDHDSDNIPVKLEGSGSSETSVKPRFKLKGPRPPDDTAAKVMASKHNTGPHRQTARQRKDIKKQAQKAARKQRDQQSAKGGAESGRMKSGMSLRNKSMTDTPPIESGFRVLYI